MYKDFVRLKFNRSKFCIENITSISLYKLDEPSVVRDLLCKLNIFLVKNLTKKIYNQSILILITIPKN